MERTWSDCEHGGRQQCPELKENNPVMRKVMLAKVEENGQGTYYETTSDYNAAKALCQKCDAFKRKNT
jgi:hypothetical protein